MDIKWLWFVLIKSGGVVNLSEIIERSKSLKIYEEREVSDDEIELVIFNEEQSQWNVILVDLLGPALKPEGVAPDKDVEKLTKDRGGIAKNQTLYKKDSDGLVVLAMLWPWGNQMHTTLKIWK